METFSLKQNKKQKLFICKSAISCTFGIMLPCDILTSSSLYWPPIIFTDISESDNCGYENKGYRVKISKGDTRPDVQEITVLNIKSAFRKS